MFRVSVFGSVAKSATKKCVPSAAKPGAPKRVGEMVELFGRVWPMVVLAFGLFATAGWIGLLGYGILKLVL